VDPLPVYAGDSQGLLRFHVALCDRHRREDVRDGEKLRRDVLAGLQHYGVAGPVGGASESERFPLRDRSDRRSFNGCGDGGGGGEGGGGEVVGSERGISGGK